MVIVEETKCKRKYKMPDKPKFKSKRGNVNWLLSQRRNARILNVKSVSVQVKDIKMMMYSNRPRLYGLYSMMTFKNELNNDEEYITITKSSELNRLRMYEILECDWLIKKDELDEMSIELVDAKKNTDECQLRILKDNKSKYPHLMLDDKIKLLEYKLESLNEYLVNRKCKTKKLS